MESRTRISLPCSISLSGNWIIFNITTLEADIIIFNQPDHLHVTLGPFSFIRLHSITPPNRLHYRITGENIPQFCFAVPPDLETQASKDLRSTHSPKLSLLHFRPSRNGYSPNYRGRSLMLPVEITLPIAFANRAFRGQMLRRGIVLDLSTALGESENLRASQSSSPWRHQSDRTCNPHFTMPRCFDSLS